MCQSVLRVCDSLEFAGCAAFRTPTRATRSRAAPTPQAGSARTCARSRSMSITSHNHRLSAAPRSCCNADRGDADHDRYGCYRSVCGNGFGDDTRENASGCSRQPRPGLCANHGGPGRTTRCGSREPWVGRLIAQSSQVQILSALPAEAPSQEITPGRRFGVSVAGCVARLPDALGVRGSDADQRPSRQDQDGLLAVLTA